MKILTDIFISKSKNRNSFKEREKSLILKSFICKSASIVNEMNANNEISQLIYETLENEFIQNFIKNQELKFKLDLKEPFLYIPISIGHLFEEYPYNVQNTIIEDNFKFDIKIFLYLLQFKNILQGNLTFKFPIPDAYLEYQNKENISTELKEINFFSIKDDSNQSITIAFIGNCMIKGILNNENKTIKINKIYPLRNCFFSLEQKKVGIFKIKKYILFTDISNKDNAIQENFFDEDENILVMAIRTFERYKTDLISYERESIKNYLNNLMIECTKIK